MNNITLDHFTLIASFIVILLSILTPMLNPFFRLKKKQIDDSNALTGPVVVPPVSLILTPLDETDKLRSSLPYFLNQDYPSGYQVVIVIEQGDHEAESIIGSVVGNLEAEHRFAEVYVTGIPKSSRYISKKKLAITLGIKAAKHDWVLPTEVCVKPVSPQWLATMARHCNETNNMVIGYGRYDDATSAFRRFERLHDTFYLMREDIVATAYRTNSFNLLFRKSEFMSRDGYLGNLHLMRGEYDFLVNKYAQPRATALEVSKEAWLIEDMPSDKTWLNKHLFYLESRKYLSRSIRHRLLFNTDQTALHVNYLFTVATAIYAAVVQNPVLLGAAISALLITIGFRGVLCRRAMRDFDEDISTPKALMYELALVWCNLNYMVRFRLADKNDFTTHKL